jgi:hypothetical protein
MFDKKSFIDLYKEHHYRKAIVDALCQGIDAQYITSFKSLLEYVITDKYDLFDRDEFKGALYLDEDETLDLILPAVRRVFGKIFIDPPTLFKDPSYGRALPESLRYKLFMMYFNADEFIDYLVDMFIRSKDCLQHFEHIDRTSETLTLIVDNYVAGLVKRVRDVENHQEAIDNVIKQIKRDDTIGEIFNDEKSNEIL